jgi:hypothetical protein
MPVLALFTNPSMTKEQYEMLRKEVGWEVSKPPGGIFHVASFDEKGGIHVADVWESADALNKFVGEKLMPVMQKHGFSAPSVEVFPVHNANAYPSVSRFVLKSGKSAGAKRGKKTKKPKK